MTEEYKIENIRNFSVVAHVNHGKSTLASLFVSHLSDYRQHNTDALYRFSLEKKKGITVKLNSITLNYVSSKLGENFIFNIIDTPGHVEFEKEVMLSLAVCEGIILLVDATKGVQSQTFFYYKMAKDLNLKIIVVISKIDSELSRLDFVKKQIISLMNCKKEEILEISSRKKIGLDKLFEEIIFSIPHP